MSQIPLRTYPSQQADGEEGECVAFNARRIKAEEPPGPPDQELDVEAGDLRGDDGRRKTWLKRCLTWPWLLAPLGVVLLAAALLIFLSVTNARLNYQLQQQQQQQQRTTSSAAAASTPAQEKTVQMASVILDTEAAPNCTNSRQLQPCWLHQPHSNQETYWTLGDLGRLQFGRDHVESSVFSLTPSRTAVQVHRTGTYGIDAQFRVEVVRPETASIHGAFLVNRRIKLLCSDRVAARIMTAEQKQEQQQQQYGQTLTCKVNNYVTLHAGDILSMHFSSALHEPLQLFTPETGSYIRVTFFG